ncbi:MAG: hypothetical protein KFF77_05635 [Bacteroidetes bacterium]|nr:hypothetical protein [Bacteroidota bacterium]
MTISMEIIDMLGRTVTTPHSVTIAEGLHLFPVTLRGLPAGIYSLLLRTADAVQQYPILVLR